MNWDEVRTRLGQEFQKRADLVRYRAGRAPAVPAIHSKPTRQPEFFFPSGQAQERAGLLRESMPALALELLHQADDIRQHRFSLLGYEGLDYGTEIDWHLDRVHGKRAPLDPWFQIPFLEFAIVGDHKVTWELNRHQHLTTLAKAWLLSHDEKYVREIEAQWQSWIKANPYPLGINWGSSLEAAFRSLSWIWTDQLLSGASSHAGFRRELVPALALHGRYIENFLSTYFSPNTHLIGEAFALFFLGTLYPQIDAASRWQRTGWSILLREAQRQVRPDGVYFEQSLHYHVYALDFFLHARLLAERNHLTIPAEYDEVLRKMLAVVQALSQAGPPEGFGDDDGGRLFDPRRNRTEHLTDPLAIGALLYGREHLPAASLTEESVWLFGESSLQLAEAAAPATPASAAFPDGGLYILSDAAPDARQIAVDAGPHGVGRSGHGHADALSLRMAVNGRRWLVDSGSGVYIAADPADRNAFRQTGAHNTMRVDGADQADAADPFSWATIPETRLDSWASGRTFTFFSGKHNGYGRLSDPVAHGRSVVLIHGGPALVRDVATGRFERDLEILWHFAAGLEVRQDGNERVTAKEPGEERGRAAMHLILPENHAWQVEVTRSLLSPAYGKLEKAPLVRVHGRMRLPAETAAVIATGAGELDGVSLIATGQTSVQGYEYRIGAAVHGFYFALDKRPWSFGPWFSDAEFLYCRLDAERLVHLVLVGGTYVAWQGRELLRASGPSRFFEWRGRDELLHAEPVPFSLTALFYELTGRTRRPAETSNPSSTYAERP